MRHFLGKLFASLLLVSYLGSYLLTYTLLVFFFLNFSMAIDDLVVVDFERTTLMFFFSLLLLTGVICVVSTFCLSIIGLLKETKIGSTFPFLWMSSVTMITLLIILSLSEITHPLARYAFAGYALMYAVIGCVGFSTICQWIRRPVILRFRVPERDLEEVLQEEEQMLSELEGIKSKTKEPREKSIPRYSSWSKMVAMRHWLIKRTSQAEAGKRKEIAEEMVDEVRFELERFLKSYKNQIRSNWDNADFNGAIAYINGVVENEKHILDLYETRFQKGLLRDFFGYHLQEDTMETPDMHDELLSVFGEFKHDSLAKLESFQRSYIRKTVEKCTMCLLGKKLSVDYLEIQNCLSSLHEIELIASIMKMVKENSKVRFDEISQQLSWSKSMQCKFETIAAELEIEAEELARKACEELELLLKRYARQISSQWKKDRYDLALDHTQEIMKIGDDLLNRLKHQFEELLNDRLRIENDDIPKDLFLLPRAYTGAKETYLTRLKSFQQQFILRTIEECAIYYLKQKCPIDCLEIQKKCPIDYLEIQKRLSSLYDIELEDFLKQVARESDRIQFDRKTGHLSFSQSVCALCATEIAKDQEPHFCPHCGLGFHSEHWDEWVRTKGFCSGCHKFIYKQS